MPPLTVNYESLVRKNRGSGSTAKVVSSSCISCEAEVPDPRLNRCPACKGAVDAFYDLDQFVPPEQISTPNPLLRYFSLLPLREEGSVFWGGEGNTPCIEVPGLAMALGIGRVFLKDESANPTRSTKDRIASVALSRFAELGIDRFVISSTGNSSMSYARAAQLSKRFKVEIFVGTDFLDRLNYVDDDAVTTYVVDGNFVAAGIAAQKYAGDTANFWEGGFFNLARREGLKVSYLEAYDAMPVTPDYIFQAISSGMGLLGAYKGAVEYRELGRIERIPSFVGVQQESCAPMAHAFSESAERIAEHHIVKDPKGLAYAILRSDPTATYPYLRNVAMRTGGAIVAVPDEGIREARRLLEEHAGLHVCYASATCLAGAVKMAREGNLSSDECVLVNLTGADRPPFPFPENAQKWAL